MLTFEKAKEIVIRVLTGKGGSDSYQDALEVLLRQCDDHFDTAYPIDDWHEDMGPALFWKIPVEDLPQVSSPLYSDFEEDQEFYGWTHFTKLRCPTVIIPIDSDKEENANDDAR